MHNQALTPLTTLMHNCIMQTTSAASWFAALPGEPSVNEAAKRVGLIQSTLSRQIKSDTLAPENAVVIARAYKQSPVTALVAIGLISEREVKEAAGTAGIRDITDEALVSEVLRRIQTGDSHPALTEPATPDHNS